MSSIRRNFVYNSLYQLLILIMPLLTTPYVSRVLGAKNVGVYAYSYSIAYFFVLFAMLGVNNYGNRSCAQVRDDRKLLSKTFWSIYFLQAILTIVFASLYIMYAIFISRISFWVSAFQIMYVISAAFDINWFFFSIEEFKLTIARNTFVKTFTMILIFLTIRQANQLWLYTLIMAGGTLLSQLVVWPFLLKYVDFYRPSFREIAAHFLPNLVLFVPAVAVSLYKYMDQVLLGMLSNMTQEGYYSQSVKIIQIPLGFISALSTVMLPKMSNLAAKHQKRESIQLINNSMLFVTFLTAGLSFGLSGIADVFIPLFLGNEFKPAGDLLVGLCISIIFVGWANVIRSQFLIPNKRDKIYLITVCFGAIVNVLTNLIFVRFIGAMGAVIANILAEASVAFSQSYLVRKELPVMSYFVEAIPFLFAGVLMTVLLRLPVYPASPLLALFIKLLVGTLFYLIESFIIIRVWHPRMWM